MFLRHIAHAALPSTFVLYTSYRYGWSASTVGLATTGAVFSVGIALLSLWGLSWAASQGLMTRHVAATEQGRPQGLDGSLRGVDDLIGPGCSR